MKKILLSLLALLPVALQAAPVGQQDARCTAKEYLASKGKFLLSTSEPHRAPRKGKTQGEAYYYVFNAGCGSGYVIISGDDRTQRVLGYVDQGDFDEETLPENMKNMLQQYADEIQALDDDNVQITPEQVENRIRARRAKKVWHSIPEILPTRWNQGGPYNSTCPKYYKSDGSQASPAAGCVAVAIAQVFYHYQHPAKTTGTIPSLSHTYTLSDGTKKTVTSPSLPAGTEIDWANILPTYGSEATSAQNTAVANLMKYVGQAVSMSYGSSSGAVTSKIRSGSVSYFGFDNCCRWVSRTSYSIDAWFDLLYSELDAGYPLIYDGSSSGGGHAFVIDGFDGEGLFHVNWGWGGSSNGWFAINSLNPGDNSGDGASTSSDGYNMGNGCLVYLRKAGVDYPYDELHMDISNISCSGTSVTATYNNATGALNSFNIGFVLENEDGSTELIPNTAMQLTGKASGASETKTINLRRCLPEGIYKISPASKLTRGKVWHAAYDFSKAYIEAKVNVLGMPTLKVVNPSPKVVVDTMIFTGTLVKGQEQPVRIRLSNKDGGELLQKLRLYGGFGSEKKQLDCRTTVAVRAGETAEYEFYFTPDDVGLFTLYLCSDDGTTTYGKGTVEIKSSSSTAANLYLSSVSITNSSGGTVYGNRLQGVVTVKNQASRDFDGKIKIQLWKQASAGSTSYWSSSSRVVPISIAAAKASTAAFNFENLSYGLNYYVVVYYVGQSGSIGNGGLWISSHCFKVNPGVVYWTSGGSIKCQASKTLLTTPNDACGVYLHGVSATKMTPSRTNPNTIYYCSSGVTPPAGLESANLVTSSTAEEINLVDGYPYYVPNTFRAQRATFSYAFPEGNPHWDTFILPFVPDTMYIGEQGYSVQSDSLPFAIYEFNTIANALPAFGPTISMRANTPYIIVGSQTLAGKTLVFEGSNALFSKSGTTNFVVSSPNYNLYGLTLEQTLHDVYTLNDEGTAFVFNETYRVKPMKTYFTTSLPDSLRADAIPLPEIPVSPDAVDVTRALPASLQPVYNLQGQCVGHALVTDWRVCTEGLKPGVYVVGGRKIFVK